MYFFTNCPDSRPVAKRNEPIGELVMLFRHSAGLFDSIYSVRVAEILEGTAFDAGYAEQLLNFAAGIDWSGRPDLLWFCWNQRGTLPMPSRVETETGRHRWRRSLPT